MSEDRALLEALDRVVPRVDDEVPDWEAVLRRARRATPPAQTRVPVSRPTRLRRRGAAFAVAAVIAVLAVAPALGLHTAVLDLFGRSDVDFANAPSAASVVKREFADMSSGAPSGMDPRVTSGEARLAGTLDGGKRVWVAPTESGQFCYLVETVSGGCVQERTDRLALDGGFVSAPDAPPFMKVIAGKVYADDAARLELLFEDETQRLLPFIYVGAPIDAGFFAYTTTADERRPGARPSVVVVRTAAGEVLAETRIDWEEEERKAEEVRRLFEERVQQEPRSP
jgi:hypothetical protein